MKKQLHGLRHGKGICLGYTYYYADTKSDNDWVLLLTADGKQVARQAKSSCGRFFHQGTNPDYEGREGYRLEYLNQKTGEWKCWDDRASRGDICSQLSRLIEAAGY